MHSAAQQVGRQPPKKACLVAHAVAVVDVKLEAIVAQAEIGSHCNHSTCLVAHAVAVVDVEAEVVVAQAGAALRLLAPHPLNLSQAGQLAQGQRAQICSCRIAIGQVREWNENAARLVSLPRDSGPRSAIEQVDAASKLCRECEEGSANMDQEQGTCRQLVQGQLVEPCCRH